MRSRAGSPAPGLDRRTLLRGLAAAGGLAALGPILAACGGDDSGDGGGGGAPSRGGKLTVGIGTPLTDFDPYNHLAVNFPMMATLYSYLITYDDQYKPTPDLAAEWSLAADNLSATIKLRDTVFHDGSPVTAQDVIAGIKRAQDPKTGISQAATSSIIKEATAGDDTTVKLTFVKPTAEARFLDFMYWFPVVQASRNDAAKLKQEAGGSGPFTLSSYAPGDRMLFKRNEKYYAQGRPYLDELEIRFFDSQDSLVSALRAGSVGGALALDARYISQLQSGFNVVKGAPGALINLFRMNPLKAPFDNKLVRQAVARAIDRDRLIKEVQNGVGAPVYTSYPPNALGFDASLLDTFAFDLDAAKQLLDSSGGQKAAVATVASADKASVSALLIIQEDLKKIGFDLQLETVDTATVNSRYLEGSLQCVVRASSNAYSSPMGVAQDSAFRLANNVLWKDELPPAYVAAVAQLDKAASSAEVDAATKAVSAVLTDESWAVGMYTVNALSVFDKSVQGFARNPADHPVFTDAYLT
ncbi:ABC transporter substrate-binding protein [Asanoa sp. NPDC050611]|uniref:ABC transporter substrate-binding protein n=1 Tax=Asanoa sp. NPDC050611 TaxID=3157098 RepID=UPI0033D7F33E